MGLGHIFEGHYSTYHAPLENNSFWKQHYLRFETKKPLKCVFHLSQPSFKVGKILQEANPESRELSACTLFRWWSSKSQSEEARQEGEEATGGCRIKLPSPWEMELSPWETQRDSTENSVILLGAEEAGVYPPAPQASYIEVCVGDIRSPALPAVLALAGSVPLKLGRDLRITAIFRKQPK